MSVILVNQTAKYALHHLFAYFVVQDTDFSTLLVFLLALIATGYKMGQFAQLVTLSAQYALLLQQIVLSAQHQVQMLLIFMVVNAL